MTYADLVNALVQARKDNLAGGMASYQADGLFYAGLYRLQTQYYQQNLEGIVVGYSNNRVATWIAVQAQIKLGARVNPGQAPMPLEFYLHGYNYWGQVKGLDRKFIIVPGSPGSAAVLSIGGQNVLSIGGQNVLSIGG